MIFSCLRSRFHCSFDFHFQIKRTLTFPFLAFVAVSDRCVRFASEVALGLGSWHVNSRHLKLGVYTETIDVTDAVGSNIRIDNIGPEVMRIVPRLNEVCTSEDSCRYKEWRLVIYVQYVEFSEIQIGETIVDKVTGWEGTTFHQSGRTNSENCFLHKHFTFCRS
ncbi:hypothetical protein P8452_66384 [Trifolium repens]|nr:hypothetical protein P8452_66384 [Trifolium repens]